MKVPKDRVTGIMCMNMTGTCKVPMTIVGSAANPRAFKDKIHRLPVKYMNQKNSWVDAKIFEKWVKEIFYPFARETHGDKKVLLIVDNAPGKLLLIFM